MAHPTSDAQFFGFPVIIGHQPLPIL